MHMPMPMRVQARAVGLVGSLVVATFIGTANFVSQMLYDAAFPQAALV